MSYYRPLIDLTSMVLIKRSKCFRKLVIVFILIIVAGLITDIAVLSFRPTVGLLLLIPAYSLYLVCDNHLLIKWRTQVMSAWRSKEIDLFALRQALSANKALPQQSINAMLETLPNAGSLVEEQSIPKVLRIAVADSLKERGDTLHYQLIRNAISFTIISSILSWAVMTNSWISLFAILSVTILLIPFELFNRSRKSTISKKENLYRESNDFDYTKYSEIINSQIK